MCHKADFEGITPISLCVEVLPKRQELRGIGTTYYLPLTSITSTLSAADEQKAPNLGNNVV